MWNFAGWTSNAASTYCSDRITSSPAYRVCRPLVSSSLSYTQSCIADLLFSGNSRIASLHLKNLQEDCRQVIETDKSLSLSTSAKEEILDSLCLSSCSGHGTCQQGMFYPPQFRHNQNLQHISTEIGQNRTEMRRDDKLTNYIKMG